METKPISDRMYSLVVLYDIHSDFFKRAIDGIKDEDAHNRLNTKANHVVWLAGSFVHERYELAKMLNPGKSDQNHATGELFKDNKGIQDNATYPSLSEFISDLEKITPQLREAYLNISDEKLDEDFEMMPGVKMKWYEMVTFMTYREANLIGQIALWRRLLGYEAMKYM